jgi:hypothetical protein
LKEFKEDDIEQMINSRAWLEKLASEHREWYGRISEYIG